MSELFGLWWPELEKELTMNSVRIAYIVTSWLGVFGLLGIAIAAPIYWTPGYYWWTALALVFVFAQSVSFTKRLNSWGGMGEL